MKGQAALMSIFFVMMIMLSAVFAVSSMALNEQSVAHNNFASNKSFYAAEAGVDDAVYRFRNNKNVPSSFFLTLNGATAVTAVNSLNNTKTIVSDGNSNNSVRTVSATLSESTQEAQFFYGVQVGDGGLTMSNNAQVNGNVFSNGNIVGAAGATISGDAIVSGGVAVSPTDQWIVNNADQFFATNISSRDIAQSFTASVGGKLNKVAVYLGRVGNPSSNITIRITSDNGGKPSTSSLASATINVASVGTTPSWINIAFSSPVTLSQGTKYWIVLDYNTNSSSHYWNWRKDSTNSYANNTGRYTNDWNSGSATWVNVDGDLLFQAWIGGTSSSIQSVTIGDSSSGAGHANLFVNTTVHGSSCPNQYCIDDSPSRQELPISDGVIQDWRNDAVAGGICAPPVCDSSGNYNLINGASGALGPIKIPGNLTISNNATLTITGTIWVAGNISLSNNCFVFLDNSYGAQSGVIVADGTITVSNNCIFQGSGSPGSYIMLLSAKNDPSNEVINVSNNSLGVIYYASNGIIEFSNNAVAKEATGYGIKMENGATITYESGLANVSFSSGPSGGWAIDSWREIAP